MSDEKLIECQYGHHLCKENEFTSSGLNNKYTICRNCKTAKEKQYREKHREEFNNKHKEFTRMWRLKNKKEIQKDT